MATSTRLLICTATGFTALALAACDRAGPPVSSPRSSLIASLVTEDVSRSLDLDGRLILGTPQSPDGIPVISEQRARELAGAYVRSFGRWHLATWERHRGSTIDLSALAVGPRAHFAHSPYGSVPADVHPAIRKLYGPYYMVLLLNGGEPVVLLAVSAFNTDHGIDPNGGLMLSMLDGNAYRDTGIPISLGARAVIDPEDAIVLVARQTGRKAAAIPELVLPGARILPTFALWKITLDAEVGVVSRRDP